MPSKTGALISWWNAASISVALDLQNALLSYLHGINSNYVSMVLNNDGVKASLSFLVSASISARVRMYVRVYVLLEQL